MGYYVLNKTEDFSHGFKSMREVADWMKKFRPYSDLDDLEAIVIQEDFDEICRLVRYGDHLSFRTLDGYIYIVKEEEFGPLYEVSVADGYSPWERLGAMTWQAVLAVVGIIGGRYES